jgi:phytanoyl-CoA hydroxylase
MSRRIDGDRYTVSDDELRHFREHGYVHLRGVLTDGEVAELEEVYDRFLRREIEVAGKDYCDMAGDYGRSPEDFSIINVMLPRRYHPAWQGNVYERRAASIAQQLCGDGMTIDYDQLLAKQPHKRDAVFAWHQDMAYWPDTPDALGTDLLPDDVVVTVPIERGDVTVHNERVMHGSGGNTTDGFRRAYVIAFRPVETVEIERSLGFTHSHNDDHEVLDTVGVDGQTRLVNRR